MGRWNWQNWHIQETSHQTRSNFCFPSDQIFCTILPSINRTIYASDSSWKKAMNCSPKLWIYFKTTVSVVFVFNFFSPIQIQYVTILRLIKLCCISLAALKVKFAYTRIPPHPLLLFLVICYSNVFQFPLTLEGSSYREPTVIALNLSLNIIFYITFNKPFSPCLFSRNI